MPSIVLNGSELRGERAGAPCATRGAAAIKKWSRVRHSPSQRIIDTPAGRREASRHPPTLTTFRIADAVPRAAISMRVDDYYPSGKRWSFRLHEKGGKRHEVPAHHNAETYVDAYLDAAEIEDEKREWMFRTVGRDRKLTTNRMHRIDVLRMIYRRATAAGLDVHACCHTSRATGITAYLENGGTIEKAQ